MKIGNTIKDTRVEKNFTQDDLANLVGISRSSLSQIENNIKTPSKTTLTKLSKALNVPEVYFYLNSLEKSDIPEDKQELYDIVFPSIQSMIKKLII